MKKWQLDGEKHSHVVYKLHRSFSILMAALSALVAIINIGTGIMREIPALQFLISPAILPFIVLTGVFTASVFIRSVFFRIFHIVIVLILAIFGGVVNPEGLSSPILFVFSVILCLQYGMLASKVWIKLPVLMTSYILGIFLLGRGMNVELYPDDFLIFFGTSILFFLLLYIAFNEEIKHALKQKEILQQEIERNRIFIQFGKNVAGVVHNLKSMLMGIDGFAECVEQEGDESTREYGNMIRQAAGNMTGIVNNLLRTVKYSQNTESDIIDLPTMLNSVLELVKANRLKKEKVLMEKVFEPFCAIYACPIEVMQLSQNLINNAFEAVERQKNAKVRLKIHSEEGRIYLTVEDNGPGIPWIHEKGRVDCLKKNIFKPGHTTKNRGSGLGMIFSCDVIRHYDGEMYVETSSNGTTFEISFPQYQTTPRPAGNKVLLEL